MNKKLKTALFDIDEVHFKELQHAVNIANLTRDLMEKFDKDREYMMQALELTEIQFVEFISGSYEYTLHDLSKVQTLWKKLEVEKAEQLKCEVVTFPKYSWSRTAGEIMATDALRGLIRAYDADQLSENKFQEIKDLLKKLNS